MRTLLPILLAGFLAPATLNAGTKVIIETSMGTIHAELDDDKAPITVKNFLDYTDKKFFDGTIFHRVMDDFMIQGGGFELVDKIGKEKKNGKGIKNESAKSNKNTRGTLAMARTNDPDSATSQFFINVKDNPALDHPNRGGYAVFGKVTKGMEVVDKIKKVKTGMSPLVSFNGSRYFVSDHANVPEEPVVIKSIRRAPAAAEEKPAEDKPAETTEEPAGTAGE